MSLDPSLEQEFERRVGDSSTLAFRVALSVVRRPADAEDVAQEAFLRAHRSFGTLRDRDRFRAWLVRTTFRLALDRIRGEKRRARREDAVAIEAPSRADSAEDAAARSELREHVAEAVAALPEKLRLVTVLVAIEEQDTAVGRAPAGAARGHGEVAPAPGAQGAGGEAEMACERHKDALSDVAAGGAPSPAFETHLASCEACRVELEGLRRALAMADDELGSLLLGRAVTRARGSHPDRGVRGAGRFGVASGALAGVRGRHRCTARGARPARAAKGTVSLDGGRDADPACGRSRRRAGAWHSSRLRLPPRRRPPSHRRLPPCARSPFAQPSRSRVRARRAHSPPSPRCSCQRAKPRRCFVSQRICGSAA